jgi:hypothetical protein
MITKSERTRFAEDMGRQVRALRDIGGHGSIAAFAKFLDLPTSTVRRCEAGRLIAPHRVFDVIMAVIERTGVSADWLSGGHPRAPTHRPHVATTSKVVLFPYWRVRLAARYLDRLRQLASIAEHVKR